MSKYIIYSTTAVCLTLLAGCASNGGGRANEHPDNLESYNRAMHSFNQGLHKRVLHPVGKGLDFVLPDIVQESISSIGENLTVPNTALNNLAQGKPKSAGQDLLRFTVNTTLGVGGIFDWASMWGIPKHEEDLGQTLGKYGVAPGPYVVLPVLGGTTARDFFGIAADPVLLAGSDALTQIQTVTAVAGLAEAADLEELAPYEEQRELFYDFRRCSIMDGAEEVSDSCQNVCTEFSEMMSSELDAISLVTDDPERLEMEAKFQNFLPVYCKKVLD